ncbi:MAG: hypothetical protein ACXW0J_01095, partial [Nitrososphaeraceae archaeon]
MFVSSYDLSFSQKDNKNKEDKDEGKDKLVVKAQINLKNIDLEKTKFIRVIGFINGEESKKDIPISSIDKSKKKLDVELKIDIDNGIVEANVPDEFFVCVYQVGDLMTEYNSFAKFDCNEGDILGNPTEISLFPSGSQVYSKSQEYYQAHLNAINITNSD